MTTAIDLAPAAPRGLVMTSDEELLDGLLRLAAAAGCELHRALDPGQARRMWASTPLVLLDTEAASRCARAALPRRDGVVLVARGEPPPAAWRLAVAVGASHVVSLPDAEPWLVERLTDAAESTGGPTASPGRVLAVVGGRGGAGASVLAAAVAVTAVREGRRALLIDCDPLGGGLDLAFGAEDLAGLRWPAIDVGPGRIPAAALHAALPAPPIDREGALALLACGRVNSGPTPGAVTAMMDAGRRAGEIVVCDLPRYPTDAAIVVLDAADLTVLVVSADVRATAAGERVAAVLAEHASDVRLVVRGPAPGGVDAATIAHSLGLPLLAAMRPEPDLARSLEDGLVPGRRGGPLAAAARSVLTALAPAEARSLA